MINQSIGWLVKSNTANQSINQSTWYCLLSTIFCRLNWASFRWLIDRFLCRFLWITVFTFDFRQSVTVYGADGLTLRKLLTHCGLFALATVAISNAYLRALEDRCPSDVTAIFATNCVFVFLLSALFLGARLISLKVSPVFSRFFLGFFSRFFSLFFWKFSSFPWRKK